MSTLETSMALAQKYIQATDPKRAAAMAEATSKISKEADPEKAKAMMASLEESLRTGDLFADMQVKAALSAYMQNKALYSQLKNDSRDATGILDKNLAERRESSSQKWAEMAQSMDDAMRSIGDALRPVTDTVAESLTKVTKSITSLTDSAPGVVAGIATVGAGLIALKGIFSTIKIGKGLLNLARGSRGGRNGSEAPNKNPGELDLVATGLDVVSRVKDAATGGGLGTESGAGNDGVKKVFVVNAGAMGGGVDASGESRRRRRGSGRSARRRSLPSSRGPRPTVPRPPVSIPSPSVPSVQSGALSKLGVVAGTVGKVSKAAKVIPGGTLLESGAMAFETFQNAKTKDEKAEGYGSAAGNLAGTMAGAAAGAAIGSVVPIIGTAIGGMIGAYLGSQGGAALGGSLGKSLFGGEDEKPEQTAKAPVPTTPLMMASAGQQGPALGDVARSMAVTAPLKSAALAIQSKEAEKPVLAKVDQQFQYSLNMPVTVQGDVKDPQALAQDLMPHMQRMMADAAKSNAAKLYDEPHV
jgi:phage tail tape-measure protein